MYIFCPWVLSYIPCTLPVTLVSLFAIPAVARQLSKTAMRQPFIEKLVLRQEEDIENFVTFIQRDGVQKALGLYLQSLKKPRT